MNRNLTIGVLILAIVIFPFVVIQFTLAKAESIQSPTYVFKARIREKLGETETSVNTKDGLVITKYQYFLVDQLDGEAPAPEFAVLIITPGHRIIQEITRGYSNVKLEPNQEFWGQAFLMNQTIYERMGDQYIFFGLPQVYVMQVKGTLLWPDQATELKLMYQAPIASLASVYYVVMFPMMDEFTLRHYVAFIAQTILIVGTIVLGIKKREDKSSLVYILLAYVVLTMLITSTVLINLHRADYESLYFP